MAAPQDFAVQKRSNECANHSMGIDCSVAETHNTRLNISMFRHPAELLADGFPNTAVRPETDALRVPGVTCHTRRVTINERPLDTEEAFYEHMQMMRDAAPDRSGPGLGFSQRPAGTRRRSRHAPMSKSAGPSLLAKIDAWLIPMGGGGHPWPIAISWMT
jgi:hypothetical protein